MQIFYGNHLVMIEDWSALLDISHAVAWASVALLIVTVALNAIAFAIYRKSQKTDAG